MANFINRALHLYRANPTVVHGAVVVGFGFIGWGALQAVEGRRAQQPVLVSNETPEEKRQRERQEQALRDMLAGLKTKTMREKLEAAADAQGKFMAPQYESVVTCAGPEREERVPATRTTDE